MDLVNKYLAAKTEEECLTIYEEIFDNENLQRSIFAGIQYYLAITMQQKIISKKEYTLMDRYNLDDYDAILKCELSHFKNYTFDYVPKYNLPWNVFTFIVDHFKNTKLSRFSKENLSEKEYDYICKNLIKFEYDEETFKQAIRDEDIDYFKNFEINILSKNLIDCYFKKNHWMTKENIKNMVEKGLVLNYDKNFIDNLCDDSDLLIVKFFVDHGANPSLSNHPFCIYLIAREKMKLFHLNDC